MARASKSRSEYTQERVLAEIEDANKRLVKLRQDAALVREGHLDPAYLRSNGNATAKELAIAEGRAEYLAEADAEIARVETELRKAWDYFGGLSDTPGRIAGTEEELQAEIAALTSRRRTLDRDAGKHREDAHDAVDAVLGWHRERITALLASTLGAGEIAELATVWAFRDPAFAEALHAAVDAHPQDAFAPGTRTQWQAEQQTVARSIAKREAELRAREAEREVAEAEQARDAALAAVE